MSPKGTASKRAAQDTNVQLHLAGLAHELRTPLTAILGYSEYIASAPPGLDVRAYAETLWEAAQALQGTLDAMLDLAAIEAGSAELTEDRVDIGRLIGVTVRMLKSSAEARRVRIDVRVAADLPLVRADERMLRQVFANLISNAVKYGGDRQPVRIAAGLTASGAMRVSIRDHGPGIAPERLAAAFRLFERLGARKDDGHGVGLALVERLVSLNGGELVLQRNAGGGTRAIITLPPEKIVGPSSERQQAFVFMKTGENGAAPSTR